MPDLVPLCVPQGKDDITGEPLIQHDDDKPEALMARLRHYKDVAKPVIDLYKSVTRSPHEMVYFLWAACSVRLSLATNLC